MDNKNELRWLLAEYFFLDNEPAEADLVSLIEFIQAHNFKKENVLKVLKYEVAPIAGKNLGFLLYPTLGVWDSFDKTDLNKLIDQYMSKRARRPSWIYSLQDSMIKRMLRILDIEKLFSRL